MQPVKTALLAGLALVLAGCSQNANFKPLENSSKVGMLDVARYTVAIDSNHSAVITLLGRGLAKSASGGTSDAVALHVTVDNPSAVPVEVTDAKLVLASGWQLAAANVTHAENSQVYGYIGNGAAPTTAPGDRINSSEFTFNLPLETDLSSLDTFRVVWTANVGGRAQSFSTNFIKNTEMSSSGRMPSVYGDTVNGQYWQNADTGEAKNTGVWNGIIGPPFGDK
jgi:hypothetical protein